MLTTDPIYFKPLLPAITIKNTANNTTLYTYSSFTGTATGSGLTNVFPLYCSVSLSQNTFGEFTIQFEDQNKVMESTGGITVGSRVLIDCGKQSSSTTRLISGLIRKKGYSRGSDNKVLYTISGTSTGIRLNERLAYVVSEARKLNNGQIDLTDPSRIADVLLAAGLNPLTADGILSIANLALNSDVETFIANTDIEYGELQDLVNYYEDLSGGEVVVDTNDLVNFRYEIKNTFFGRGFTIKNGTPNANDDADDTMYLVGKNWSYEDDFYKSSQYANRLYSLLPAETETITGESLGYAKSASAYFNNDINSTPTPTLREWAVYFRPTHSRFYIGDFFFGISTSTVFQPSPYTIPVFRVIKDYDGNVPLDANGVVANIVFDNQFDRDNLAPHFDATYHFVDTDGTTGIDSFTLDMTQNYWLVLSDDNAGWDSGGTFYWTGWLKSTTINSRVRTRTGANPTTYSNGGAGWGISGSDIIKSPIFAMQRRRSHSFFMYDPKAMQAVSSGLTGGLATDTLLTDASTQITSFDSMYRYMQQQTYNLARPRTSYSFPSVLAPNISPLPGDPIIISDSILGFSTSGNQIALTTCGDMSYQWGNMNTGSYDAPTKLSINTIGIHSRYR